MQLTQAITEIEQTVSDPKKGLTKEVFQFVSRLTPLVNVDLLIKDDNNRILLAWRDDQFAGQGWHIPGGIVRFKESFEARIEQVALTEIGCPVIFNPNPIAINQTISKHDTRGHFISLLYQCSVNAHFIPDNNQLSITDPGYLMWHANCPDNLVRSHEIYRQYLI